MNTITFNAVKNLLGMMQASPVEGNYFRFFFKHRLNRWVDADFE